MLSITWSAHLQLPRQLHMLVEAQHQSLRHACVYLSAQDLMLPNFSEFEEVEDIILSVVLQILLRNDHT